jgi:hypothetical protein
MKSRARPAAATTLSSREFNQDTGLAKRATKRGPVFITDRGKPSHVLLAFDDYVRPAGGPNIVELLTMPTSDEMELEVPRARALIRKPDLS